MKPENPHYGDTARKCWQEGFDAAVKFMNEPCTEHYVGAEGGAYKNIKKVHCPECMKEVK